MIEMKMMLSMPRTISIADNVNSAIQVSGRASEAKIASIGFSRAGVVDGRGVC